MVIALWLIGCSASLVDPVACDGTATCRDTFGVGYVCGDAGYCEATELDPRCTLFPESIDFPVPPGERYLVGSMFNLADQTYVARQQSARLAVIQANNNGGLNERELGYVHCTVEEDLALDDLDLSSATTYVADYLAGTLGIPVVVGPSASSRAELAYLALSPYDAALISPSATSPALTALDGEVETDEAPGLLWRTAPPDDLQGRVIAQDMLDRGVATAAVIYQEGAYGDGLAAVFTTELEAGGGAVNAYPYGNSSEIGDEVARVANEPVDEVLFVSSDVTEVIAFLNSASALDAYDELPIFLLDAGRSTQILTEATEAAGLFDQIRGTVPSPASGFLFDSFLSSYAGLFGEQADAFSFTAHSYDASWLALYGLAWATANEDGPVTGLGVARGLRRVSSGDEIELYSADWEIGLETIQQGTSIDVRGASGELDFDPDTGEVTAPIDVWTINAEADDFEIAYTVEP